MFHRRLLLLAVLACATTVVLAARTAQLTLRDGAGLRREVEAILSRDEPTPTLRGTIYDRKHRMLAQDRTSYDLAVSYAVLTGQWVSRQAEAEAQKIYKDTWRHRSGVEQARLIAVCRPAYEKQLAAFWGTLAQVTGQDAAALEHRRAAIVQRVDKVARSYWTRKYEQQLESNEEAVTSRAITQLAVREQTESHILIEDLDSSARLELERFAARAQESSQPSVWREVSIRFASRRDYPWDVTNVILERDSLPAPLRHHEPVMIEVHDVGRHVIGGMRNRILADDEVLQNYAFSRANLHGYKPDDPIGASGIEESREGLLRGERGLVTNFLDGRPPLEVPPTPGQDLTLTLDIQLQARVQAIMDPGTPKNPGLGLMRSQSWHHKPKDKSFVPRDGEALNGAAVVLDVASGEVLAAVSVPWYPPAELADDPAALQRWELINASWRNRVVAQPYPPGSTIKPLVLAALYTEGKLGYNETLPCEPGYLYPEHPDRFRCWLHKATGSFHGNLTGPEAICRSCNVFFFRAGLRLGGESLCQWYERFGLGSRTYCGLDEEVATVGAMGHGDDEAAMMAIGQGPLEWTLIQAANTYATLARDGVTLSPTFIRQPEHDRRYANLHLAPRTISQVLEGLRLAANDPDGTAASFRVPPNNLKEKNFNLEGVEVFAKSGTAEAPDLRLITENLDGSRALETIRQGDHAWTICLVKQPDAPQPQYVIAVVVECGGSGGQTAAPIVNQILHALRAEGYL